MKTLLIAVTTVSMFVACKSKNPEIVETNSSVVIVDSLQSQKLPDGTKRVVVVESRNADGSSTITTTTDINTKSATATKASPAASPKETSSAPVASTAPVVAPEKKKGWSTRAKGAAIGGVGGAAAGVILSKDKVKGGILGGAIGAGGGYIIGNEIDRNKAKNQ